MVEWDFHHFTIQPFNHSTIRLFQRSTLQSGVTMAESVYKVIELVGTSTESWEKAAAAAINRAAKSIRDLRVAEVSELDMQIENGKVKAYRAKVKVSFKYEGKDK
jgi:dodecin